MNVEVLEKTNSKVILQQFVKMLYLEISRQNEDLTYLICSDTDFLQLKDKKRAHWRLAECAMVGIILQNSLKFVSP